MHARPAAAVSSSLSGLDATVTVERVGSTLGALEITGPTALLAVGGRQGERLLFSASGVDAELALAHIRELVEAGFGESLEPAAAAQSTTAPAAGPIGVSPGRAVGEVVRMPEPISEPPSGVEIPHGARADESMRIAHAATRAADELRRRAAAASPAARGILAATVAFAEDPGLLEEARRAVLIDGATAERAIWDAYSPARRMLSPPRAAERASVPPTFTTCAIGSSPS